MLFKEEIIYISCTLKHRAIRKKNYLSPQHLQAICRFFMRTELSGLFVLFLWKGGLLKSYNVAEKIHIEKHFET